MREVVVSTLFQQPRKKNKEILGALLFPPRRGTQTEYLPTMRVFFHFYLSFFKIEISNDFLMLDGNRALCF